MLDSLTSKQTSIFLEKILILNNEIDTYNKNIFLEDAISNIQLLKYYKQIIKKRNIDFYYNDNSFLKDIKSVSIFSPQLSKRRQNYLFIDDKDIKQKIENEYIFYNYFYNILMNKINDKQIYELIDLIKNNNLFLNFNYSDFAYPFEPINYNTKQLIIDFILNKEIYFVPEQNIIYKNFYNYYFISNLITKSKYSKKNIKKILKDLSIEITNKQYEQIKNNKYFYFLKYIIPFIVKNNYNSESFIYTINFINKKSEEI